MVAVTVCHLVGEGQKNFLGEPGEEDGGRGSVGKPCQQLEHCVAGFAFAKNRFRQANACRPTMVKKDAMQTMTASFAGI